MAEILRVAVADKLGKSIRVEDIRRAAKLDSINPQFHYRMGLFYELNWEQENLGEAINQIKKAISLQPNRADYWSDLGRVCFTAGDDYCAEEAYERAVRLAPNSPNYRWLIANYCLLAGRQSEALAHFQRFLELSSGDPSDAFSIFLRAINDPRIIWQVLPANGNNLKLTYIYFLSTHGYPDDAFTFWSDVSHSGLPVSFSEARPYLEQLIAGGSFARALQLWRYLENTGGIRALESHDSSNLIYNGRFEQEPLGAGFDWRHQGEGFLIVDTADEGCCEGRHCLSIDFSVPQNAAYEPIYQIVPVEPNQQYLLLAKLRSRDITSDSGPRLRVVDSQCPACLSVESEGVTGSTPWHEVSITFSTALHTHALRISVWRARSRSFPMEIQGRFWLDSVSLRAVGTRQQ